MPLHAHAVSSLCLFMFIGHGDAQEVDGFIHLPGVWFSDSNGCSNFAFYADKAGNPPPNASLLMLCDQDPRCRAFSSRGWMKDYTACPAPADAPSGPTPSTYLSMTRCNATHNGSLVDASCGSGKKYLACEGISINPPDHAIASYTLPPGVDVRWACKEACTYQNCTAMSVQGQMCWLYAYSEDDSTIGYIQMPASDDRDLHV